MTKISSLKYDQESKTNILTEIENDISYKATNIYFLVISVLLACIGLNTGSSTVVIWAMLVSQIMAPMVWIWMGLGLENRSLLKKSFKNLGFWFLIAFIISLIYFYLSPISLTNNEIISRSNITIWDALVAFLSWVAWIIWQTRKKEIWTILPWVSLANTLLPPISVAAFRIVRWEIFLASKAVYLFLINFIFIVAWVFLMSWVMWIWIQNKLKNKLKYGLYILLLITIFPAYNFSLANIKNLYLENEIKNFWNFLSSQNIGFLESDFDKNSNALNIYFLNSLDEKKTNDIKSQFFSNKYFKDKKLNIIQSNKIEKSNIILNKQVFDELKIIQPKIISIDIATKNIFLENYNLTALEKEKIQKFLLARTWIENIIFSEKKSMLDILKDHIK